MRRLVAFVICLIGIKLGYQEYVYRVATRDVIIGMVRERAVQQCQRQAKASVVTASGTIAATAWARPESISLKIGRSGIDVQMWQVGSPQWNARYRDPFLLIVPEGAVASVACEYDIINGAASVQRL